MSYKEIEQTWDGELRIKRGTNHAVPTMEVEDYHGDRVLIYNATSLMVLREQAEKQIKMIEEYSGYKFHFIPVERCVVRSRPHRHIVTDDEEKAPRLVPDDVPGACIWSSETNE
jgi:hypothetical protein